MNPFRFSGPVAASDVIDREAELQRLLSTAESANSSRLLAPREYGKTSLLNKLIAESSKRGWATVYVDFFGVMSLADVAERIESAYRSQLRGDLATWFESIRRRFRSVRIGGGPVPAAMDVDASPGEHQLLERLEMPPKIMEARGVRTLVVFDEFQDVLEARDDADEVIRSAIQHHGETASYVFAGSELGTMRELFASRRRAFFRQGDRVDLRPLAADDLGAYLVETFKAGGKVISPEALGALLDRVDGHPRCAMVLAHELWERAKSGKPVDLKAFDEAERSALEATSSDLRVLWRGLRRSDREVLGKIANGAGPYSRSPASPGVQGGTVKASLQRLEDTGEVLAEGDGGYRIVDPFLAELIRREWNP